MPLHWTKDNTTRMTIHFAFSALQNMVYSRRSGDYLNRRYKTGQYAPEWLRRGVRRAVSHNDAQQIYDVKMVPARLHEYLTHWSLSIAPNECDVAQMPGVFRMRVSNRYIIVCRKIKRLEVVGRNWREVRVPAKNHFGIVYYWIEFKIAQIYVSTRIRDMFHA